MSGALTAVPVQIISQLFVLYLVCLKSYFESFIMMSWSGMLVYRWNIGLLCALCLILILAMLTSALTGC